MPPPVGVRAERPQGGDEDVFVTLPTADLEGCGELPVRCLHVPAPHLDKTKADEALREEFSIPKALRQGLCLLGILCNKGHLLFRLLLVMGRRQMTETCALLARSPGCACHLAHVLKIRNRFIV